MIWSAFSASWCLSALFVSFLFWLSLMPLSISFISVNSSLTKELYCSSSDILSFSDFVIGCYIILSKNAHQAVGDGGAVNIHQVLFPLSVELAPVIDRERFVSGAADGRNSCILFLQVHILCDNKLKTFFVYLFYVTLQVSTLSQIFT